MPDYSSLGHAEQMGPPLRRLVETQLLHDLPPYGINPTGLRFDWSESCVEGRESQYLDGRVDNYSGIALFSETGSSVAEGWMEFIHRGSFFLAYWETLFSSTLGMHEGPGSHMLKTKAGIPHHVWQQIPAELRPQLAPDRMRPF